MELGSPEHKAQFIRKMLETFQENIWKDEMTLSDLEEIKVNKRKEMAAIHLKLDNKEFKPANEGKKALFVAERELEDIEKEMETYQNAINNTWPARMQLVRAYAERQDISVD